MDIQQKTQHCRDSILQAMRKLPLAGYLYQEVEQLLASLNYYRLTNLQTNQEAFFAYLTQLDQENTRFVQKILQNK